MRRSLKYWKSMIFWKILSRLDNFKSERIYRVTNISASTFHLFVVTSFFPCWIRSWVYLVTFIWHVQIIDWFFNGSVIDEFTRVRVWFFSTHEYYVSMISNLIYVVFWKRIKFNTCRKCYISSKKINDVDGQDLSVQFYPLNEIQLVQWEYVSRELLHTRGNNFRRPKEYSKNKLLIL